MILKNEEIGITVRAVPTAAPPDGDTPYGRDMRTPQQNVDDPEMGYTGFQFVLLTELIDDPAQDSELYGSPIHDEILNAVASNSGVDGAVPQPVLAFTTADGRIVLEFGDFGEVFEFDQQPKYCLKDVIDLSALRDGLWTEWRVRNKGIPAIDHLPTVPPEPSEEGPFAMDWADCLAYHNLLFEYESMNDDQLRDAVLEHRLGCYFGDGLERDYAMDGGCTIGEPIGEMNRMQMVTELMGEYIDKPCEHEHSHLNNEVTAHRFCNDCKQEVEHVDEIGDVGHTERWRMVDELAYLFADGRNQEFTRQIWEMLDTRTIEQLCVLTGRSIITDGVEP